MYAQIENPLLAAVMTPVNRTDAAIVAYAPFARPLVYAGNQTDGPANPLLLESIARWSAWKDIMLVPLYTLVLTILLSVPCVIFFERKYAHEAPEGIELIALCAMTLSLIAVVNSVLRKRKLSIQSVGLGTAPLTRNVLIGLALGVALLVVDFVGMPLIEMVAPGSLERDSDEIGGLIAVLSPFALAPFAFLVAVSEELFFRGFLMTRLRRGIGSWTVAVALTTAFFVAGHDIPPGAIPFIAIPSIAWSIITIRRKSIVPAITSHFFLDTVLFFATSLSA